MKTLIYSALATVLLYAGDLAVIYASEGGGEHHEGSPWMDLLFKAVNFAVLVWILVHFAKKPVKDGLTSSAEVAKQTLEDARNAKKQAEAELANFSQKLSQMKQEADAMVTQARKDAELEKTRILAEAEALSKKIQEQARFTIEQEYKKAEAELKAWVAREAMQMAEQMLQAQMTETHQQQLVTSYINDLRSTGEAR